MSADNWAKCPRCIAKHEAQVAERAAQVEAAYGSVSVAEFDQMRADLAAFRAQGEDYDFARTFREDYEFYGAEEGFVTADYRGGCATCGLGLKFEFTRHLDVDGAS